MAGESSVHQLKKRLGFFSLGRKIESFYRFVAMNERKWGKSFIWSAQMSETEICPPLVIARLSIVGSGRLAKRFGDDRLDSGESSYGHQLLHLLRCLFPLAGEFGDLGLHGFEFGAEGAELGGVGVGSFFLEEIDDLVLALVERGEFLLDLENAQIELFLGFAVGIACIGLGTALLLALGRLADGWRAPGGRLGVVERGGQGFAGGAGLTPALTCRTCLAIWRMK
jgi:hypothetical protein